MDRESCVKTPHILESHFNDPSIPMKIKSAITVKGGLKNTITYEDVRYKLVRTTRCSPQTFDTER